MTIIIKNEEDIKAMRVAGKLAGELLDYITPLVVAGVSTEQLDRLCYDYIINVQQAYPSPLNYQPDSRHPPYPKSICTSINQEICHGIPSERILKNGDIVNIDVTVYKNGYHGDSSRMFLIGQASSHASRLCKITHDAMYLGINQVKPNNTLGDIGYAIQQYAEDNGYSVVREFCGHGIGKIFHEDGLQVLHYGKKGAGIKLVSGMIFTIEPMINQGRKELRFMNNGWTAVTKDRSLSAQWEHTILVTETGYEILTLAPLTPPLPKFITDKNVLI